MSEPVPLALGEFCMAQGHGAWHSSMVMKPIINIQENIGKTVGKRKLPQDAFAYGMGIQKSGNQLRASFGHGGLCPKGVFRFKTHEEADAWTMKMLIAQAAEKK